MANRPMGQGLGEGEESLGAIAVLYPDYSMFTQKYTCDEVSISTPPKKKSAHVKTGGIQIMFVA